MTDFFSAPILNSPYERPSQHWELDDDGQPTQQVVAKRRAASYVTPIPKPKRRRELSPQGACAEGGT
jgi:type III restriction enzyme